MTLDQTATVPSAPAGGLGDRPTPHRRRWPVVLAVILGVALGAVALWAFVLRSDDATTSATAVPQLVAVTSGTMGTSVSAEGTVAAAHTEDLSFSSAGTVKTVDVAAGDTVTAGQVLATIDSSQLSSEVADATSKVAEAKAKLADDSDAGASDEQLAADRSALTSAEDSLASAQAALDGARLVASIDGVVTTVDLTVGEQLGSSGSGGTTATGTATGSGQSASTLGSAQAAGPQAVSSQTQSSTTSPPQVQIVSSGHYAVDLAVDSSDISKIEVGQSATLTISTSSSSSSSSGFDGFPGGGPPGFSPSGPNTSTSANRSGRSSGTPSRSSASDVTATGTVTTVGRVADASSGVATYPVTVTFDADASKVFVGSTATAEIAVSQRSDVIQVPERAVTTSGGRSVVTVATEGRADGATEQREVTTGETSSGMVEITSGLKAGEQVVIEVPGVPGGGQQPGTGEVPGGFAPPGAQGSGTGGSNGPGAATGTGG